MRYAIVGFGCAGFNAARAIRTSDSEGEIHIFEATGNPPVNPMLTTYYTSNQIGYQALFPFGTIDEIQQKYHLTIHAEQRVQHIFTQEKALQLENGSKEQFDRILISTGARAFAPPIEGLHSDNVFMMRTMADAVRLRERIEKKPAKRAVVVGASMVGIKVAELLNERGISTTLVDFAQYLFPLAAFENVARELERRVSGYGIAFLWGKALTTISDSGVKFADDSELPADIICLCIGTRANVELVSNTEVIEGEQIQINKGIVVDEHMRTNLPDIYAAGDCCEGTNLQTGQTMIIGLWQNAGIQGDVAGHNMAGTTASYRGTIPHNITHFMDVYFIGIGNNRAEGELITFGQLQSGTYVQAVKNNGFLKCVNVIGNSEVGGILKSFFLKQLSRNQETSLPKTQRMVLLRNGLTEDFIRLLEGGLK